MSDDTPEVPVEQTSQEPVPTSTPEGTVEVTTPTETSTPPVGEVNG